jgi:hypothetical protein
MKRLFWKEFRERRWWALVWFLSIVGTSLFAGGQAFFGEGRIHPHPAQALPLAIGLLVGLGGYSSELAHGRAQSVFSRPISGMKLLVVKILFGAIIALAAPLLAAVIEGIIAPAHYRHLISGPDLLLGALGPAWKNGLIYLLGLACSTIIPGLAGGMLTLISVIIVTITLWLFSPANEWISSYEPPIAETIARNTHILAARVGLILGAGFGAIFAGLFIAHSALVLGQDVRVKRFTFRLLPVLLVGLLAGCLLPAAWLQRALLRWEVVWFRPNGTGTAALVYEALLPWQFDYALPVREPERLSGSYGRRQYLVNMHDGRQLPISDYQRWQWLSTDYAAGTNERKSGFYLADIGNWKMTVFEDSDASPLSVSPNARILAARYHYVKRLPDGTREASSASNRRLVFIHLPSKRILKEEPWPGIMVRWRWETDELFSYRYAPTQEVWGHQELYRTRTIRVTE